MQETRGEHEPRRTFTSMIVGPARPRLESRHYTIAEAAARLFLGHGRHLGTGLGAPAMVQDLRGEGLERLKHTVRENSGAISLSLVDSRIKSIRRLIRGNEIQHENRAQRREFCISTCTRRS